ncbi:hypothetical protein BDW74DRAFT_190188 [Aspergillus multicolor]|uniref:uncharacterized protein n=1 Tax=Aspergillus multicolor TaxID=41759 RepID=UPI003CCD4F30
MAPFPYRTLPTPLIQQQPLIAPPFTPLFLQLLAGTVCIFILSVGRVLREGNAPSSRYAKTWYGWVPAQRHEARKRALLDLGARIRSRNPWKSTSADYDWVWQYAGQKEPAMYNKRPGPRMPRAIPVGSETNGGRWSSSYPHSYGRMTPVALGPVSPPLATGALQTPDTTRPISTPIRDPTRTVHVRKGVGGSHSSGYSAYPQMCRGGTLHGVHSNASSQAMPYVRKTFTSPPELPFSRASSRPPLGYSNHTQSSPHSYSMPCLSQPTRYPIYQHARSSIISKSRKTGTDELSPSLSAAYCCSRKYQVWSARMGLQTLKCLGYSTRTLPIGPPGSPRTAFLGSISFESATIGPVHQYRQGPNWTSSSDISDLFLCSSDQQHNIRRPASLALPKSEINMQKEGHTLSLLRSHMAPSHRPTLLTWYENSLPSQKTSVTRVNREGKQVKRGLLRYPSAGKLPHMATQPKNWSNWEVRLIENLDRKLGWISDQLTPGQRPFHFALLANHWLNRETWIVYDPVSRVDTKKRRIWGDPRFNVPYPKPTLAPTPRFLAPNRRLAHPPKIKSWRLAVNRHRKVSGLKAFLHSIEHCGSSADEPPDGEIDPSSWVLRKPPQGVGLSARHGEKYYEGGAGWQEKLSDWQRIRRGYRIRKAIYEGRVNRKRAKEIVYGITRYYRQATKHLMSNADRYHDESWELSIDESC